MLQLRFADHHYRIRGDSQMLISCIGGDDQACTYARVLCSVAYDPSNCKVMYQAAHRPS